MIAEAPAIEISPTRKKWTAEEVAQIDDEIRRELHDGEIVEMPSPALNHQKLYLRLLYLLNHWLQSGGTGLLYAQPVDLRVSGFRTLIPDLCFYASTDTTLAEEPNGKYLVGAPDLVVEIISPSSEQIDRVYKRRVYAEMGVRYYWLLNPETKIFEAMKLENGRYELEAAMIDEGTFSPELFPALEIDLVALFAF